VIGESGEIIRKKEVAAFSIHASLICHDDSSHTKSHEYLQLLTLENSAT
jgi:hypothetical protein